MDKQRIVGMFATDIDRTQIATHSNQVEEWDSWDLDKVRDVLKEVFGDAFTLYNPEPGITIVQLAVGLNDIFNVGVIFTADVDMEKLAKCMESLTGESISADDLPKDRILFEDNLSKIFEDICVGGDPLGFLPESLRVAFADPDTQLFKTKLYEQVSGTRVVEEIIASRSKTHLDAGEYVDDFTLTLDECVDDKFAQETQLDIETLP